MEFNNNDIHDEKFKMGDRFGPDPLFYPEGIQLKVHLVTEMFKGRTAHDIFTELSNWMVDRDFRQHEHFVWSNRLATIKGVTVPVAVFFKTPEDALAFKIGAGIA
jgi:hypothetical protein